jgi:hypothetical protein
MELEGKLIDCVEKPLKTSVYSLLDNLPNSLVEKLMDTIGWKNSADWVKRRFYDREPALYTHGTRSICLTLSEDERKVLSANSLLPINAVQLKGLIYIPSEMRGYTRYSVGEKITYPIMERFEDHNVTVISVREDGFFTSMNDLIDVPKGGLLRQKMKLTIGNLKKARAKNIIAPLAIGFGFFDELDFKGHKVGFTIDGVYEPWNARLFDFFRNVQYINPSMKEGYALNAPHPAVMEYLGLPRLFFKDARPCQISKFEEYYNGIFEEYATRLFVCYGKELAKAHKNKITFYNPHIDNVLPIKDRLAIYDWEHTTDISKLSPQMQVGHCTLDIRNLFVQMGIFINVADQMEASSLKSISQMLNPYALILHGYGLDNDVAKEIGEDIRSSVSFGQRLNDFYLRDTLMPQVARVIFN